MMILCKSAELMYYHWLQCYIYNCNISEYLLKNNTHTDSFLEVMVMVSIDWICRKS